ncbi:MAG TPA: YraN family protein [Acidimicrobiia bacterium]
MGHVPTGPLPAEGEGPHLPRRERRGAGAARDLDLSDRAAVGDAGERIAARFLSDHGLRVLARNVGVGTGEIDLLAIDHGVRVVAEVRAITGDGDPIDAVGARKRQRVRRLAAMAGAQRVDFVGVRLGVDGVVVHWVPGCG